MFECFDRPGTQRCGQRLAGMSQGDPEQIPWRAGDARDAREIVARFLRRFHVQTLLLKQ